MLSRIRKKRPIELGPYPLEKLTRDISQIEVEISRPKASLQKQNTDPENSLEKAAQKYRKNIEENKNVTVFSKKAPVPDDLGRRVRDIKGAGYFLDSSQVGICEIPENAWLKGAKNTENHTRAIVILVEFGRDVEQDNLAAQWLKNAQPDLALTRAAEISSILTGYIGALGFHAACHWQDSTKVDIDRLTVLAGLAIRTEGELINPFVDKNFALAVVTTPYELACDSPLHKSNLKSAKNLSYFLGTSGAVSGLERWRKKRRPSHLGPYPVEILKRQDEPTTRIFADEVPRIPQRAMFYIRAAEGDMGPKALKERPRWAYKHPMSQGLLNVMWPMAKLQDDKAASKIDPSTIDAAENTKAIKALAHHMGVATTGICEIPDYCWYSHRKDGDPIEPYHKYAITMLIDQGMETFDGACGDDWISGSQSMRSYMRGAEVAGIIADHVRQLGHPARPQTNLDSDVVHIPLLVLSGLGELSRIGETVLNPFIGPRFKTVVMTTNMPLLPDKPIDFGLQEFCGSCTKCARECPSFAIPFGEKTFFNGYETWKPDSERCTKYRMTNMKGSACGRCIKTCPLTKDITWDGPWLHRIGSWLGLNVMWLKPYLAPFAIWLDDILGYGNPNDAKKWWLDLEVKGESCHEVKAANHCDTPKQTNRKMIRPDRIIEPEKQKIAYYPASVVPAPDHEGPCLTDRKAGLAFAEKAETVEQAIARKKAGGPPPVEYKTKWTS